MESVQRGVMFVLQTSLASDADNAFQQIENRIRRLQGMGNIRLGVRGTGATASPSAAGGSSPASSSQAQNAQATAEQAFQRRMANMRREGAERQRVEQERMAKIVEKTNAESLQRQIRDLEKAEAEKQRILAQSQRARDLQFKQEQQSDAGFWKGFERHGQQTGRQRHQQEQRHQRDEQQRVRAGNRQLSQLVRTGGQAQEQDQRRAERDRELALARQREAQQRVTESLNGSLDAAMRLARGFTQLGLVGERDIQKIADALLTVQGTIDTVRGGIDTFRTFGSAIGAMRNARTVQGIPRAAGGAGGVMRTAGSLLGLGAPAAAAGGGGAAGTGTAGGSLAAASGPIAAFVAAVASAALAIKATASTISDTRSFGFRGGAAPGSYNSVVGGAEEGLVRRGINMGHSVASAVGMGDRTFNRLAKFGLNTSPIGALFTASVDAAQIDRSTQERVDRHQRQRAAQGEINARHAAAFQGAYQERVSGLHALQDAGERHARFIQTGDPQADLQIRLRLLQAQQFKTEQVRGFARSERISTEGPNGAIFNPEKHAAADAAEKEMSEEVLRLKQQQLEVTKEIQKTAIDGLKNQLQLQTQTTRGVATSKTQGIKGQVQGVGRMNSLQLQNLENIYKRMKGGHQLSEDELQLAENSGIGALQRGASEQLESLGKRKLAEFAPSLAEEVGNEEEVASSLRRKANLREQAEVNLQNGIGRQDGGGEKKVDVDVQHKLILEMSGSAQQLTEEIAAELGPQMADALKGIAGQIMQQLQGELGDAVKGIRQQGRVFSR